MSGEDDEKGGRDGGSEEHVPESGTEAGVEATGGELAEDAAGEGGSGDRDQEEHGEGPSGSGDGIPDPYGSGLNFPNQTPLFHAQHAERYARQELIRVYENTFSCRLIVMIDVIFPESVTYFEELISDANPAEDLHLLLDTPGGDGETAIRLVRSAQARCRELTVIVPNQAKSAGTILAIGAHWIIMGPASDLGPVDPQFMDPSRTGALYSAKDLIAAVDAAEKAITKNPETYALHASLLADVTEVMVQQARSALARSDDLVREALACNDAREPQEVTKIAKALKKKLIDLPTDHGAVFGARDAHDAGLPIKQIDPASIQWKMIWRLWAKYFTLRSYVYEGRLASHRFARGE